MEKLVVFLLKIIVKKNMSSPIWYAKLLGIMLLLSN